MPQTPPPDRGDDAPNLGEYPALAGLGITADELKLLTRQGFVSKENRGSGVRYKLRFRKARRQIVRSMGDALRAAQVEEELRVLQAETRFVRKLRASVNRASRRLKEAKHRLEPLLHEHGLVFHGLEVRRPRLQAHPISSTPKPPILTEDPHAK